MLIRMITICSFTCYIVIFCLPSFGGQVGTYELRVENNPDVPLRIISASVKSQPAGKLVIHMVVENLGKLPVEEVVLALPDGPSGFGFPLKAGETIKVDTPLMTTQAKKMRAMARRGELAYWTVSVTSFHWSEEAGVPIQMDLSSQIEPSMQVEVTLPKEGVYFPQELGTLYPPPPGMELLGYARAEVHFHNTSDKCLREVWWKLEVPVGAKWESIDERGVVVSLSPGQSTAIKIRLPVEVLDAGVSRHFKRFQFVFTKARYE